MGSLLIFVVRRARGGESLRVDGIEGQIGHPLMGELEVAMHEGDRYAAFTDGCSHALH